MESVGSLLNVAEIRKLAGIGSCGSDRGRIHLAVAGEPSRERRGRGASGLAEGGLPSGQTSSAIDCRGIPAGAKSGLVQIDCMDFVVAVRTDVGDVQS